MRKFDFHEEIIISPMLRRRFVQVWSDVTLRHGLQDALNGPQLLAQQPIVEHVGKVHLSVQLRLRAHVVPPAELTYHGVRQCKILTDDCRYQVTALRISRTLVSAAMMIQSACATHPAFCSHFQPALQTSERQAYRSHASLSLSLSLFFF
jgi:hypothetical protein